MTSNYKEVLVKLLEKRNLKQSQNLARFFKTKKGEYGYGDIFLGIKVPIQRSIAKEFKELSLPQVQKLLENKYHECRLTGLLILTYKFPKANQEEQKNIYDLYIKNLNHINNWDLVDLSAPNILGAYLFSRSHRSLYNLVKSKNLWYRRIAILSTFYFIKNDKFNDSLKIAQLLLNDKHDLIHKAVGWMLREVGKRNKQVLFYFLDENFSKMPRTCLRYAIERLPQNIRKGYLQKKTS